MQKQKKFLEKSNEGCVRVSWKRTVGVLQVVTGRIAILVFFTDARPDSVRGVM